MGCANSIEVRLEQRHAEALARMEALHSQAACDVPSLSGSLSPGKRGAYRTISKQRTAASLLEAATETGTASRAGDSGFDVFVSHCKKHEATEDRAVWVADVCEVIGLVAFFDRSDLREISEPVLRENLLASSVVVTILDDMTFNSGWVYKENAWAANAGIPILPIYDADRFRWEGQLQKWASLYPWVFQRQALPLTKTQRRASAKAFVEAVRSCLEEERKPLPQSVSEVLNDWHTLMKAGVGGSRETNTASALESASHALSARLERAAPSLLVAAFTCTHDAEKVAQKLHQMYPNVPMIGCTTCRGVVFNETWLTYQNEFALGLWGIADDAGSYAVVHITERSGCIREAVRTQVQEARAVRDDAPNFVILLGAPGKEEDIIEGIQEGVGCPVPILGGSSADNSMAGRWKQIAKSGTGFAVQGPKVSSNGICIALAWSSCHVATALTSGFAPTSHRGKVTKVQGGKQGRKILQIDGMPAKQVYDGWTRGKASHTARWERGVANITAAAALMPLGEPLGGQSVRVLQPAYLHAPDGGITVLADAREGMDVMLLAAAPEALARQTAQSARELAVAAAGTEAFQVREIIGALTIFCGGLVMFMEEQMPLAAEHLANVVGHNNTMGICCFGQQGMDELGRAMHGNLMFGCLLISNRPRFREDLVSMHGFRPVWSGNSSRRVSPRVTESL